MSKKNEALKLALEALEVATTPFARDRQEVLRAQAALREALAEQPAQQEPVGTYGEIFESMRSLLRSGKQADQQIYMAMQDKPLYTSPPAQRKPLTDEQIKGIYEDCDAPTGGQFTLAFARAIEAAHGIKEKNT